MRVRRFFGFVLGGAVGQGTVLVVCMGEYTDFLDSFWGAPGFFNVMMQKYYCVFAAALLHKVDLVMLSLQQMKFTA